MQRSFLHRVVKFGVEDLNAFITVLRSRVWRVELQRRGASKKTSAAVATLGRPPIVPRSAGFLLCGVFPVVKAWSPWVKKKKGGEKEDEDNKNQTTSRSNNSSSSPLRLVDKKDKQLRVDIAQADEWFESGNTANYEKAFDILMLHLEKREPEVLWRLGRLTYEKSKVAQTKDEKRQRIEEAYDLVFKSMTIDEKNFAVHKWMAILLNELSTFKGIKDQLLTSVNVKRHMLRAVELNPEDATSIYLLGVWCYSVADIPWYQRKVAETLFAKPPECQFEEAYKHFLRAEYTQPGFYSMNLLMLAKSCVKTGDMEKAEQYLWKLQKVKVKTQDDFMAKKEGKQLREKLFKAGNNYSTTGESAEQEKT